MQLSINYQSPESFNPFLSEVAEHFLANITCEIPEALVVFPNIRSGTFFKKYLLEKLDKPSWLPQITSFEEFVYREAELVPANRYDLVLSLYKVFNEIDQREEGLEDFYFWGEMLLNDFEDIDQQLVDYKKLFHNLEKLRGIEAIEYLDEDQKKLIERFWASLSRSKNKDKWLEFWFNLEKIFARYRAGLEEQGIGYKGLIYRRFTSQLEKKGIDSKYVLFAGFNALTKAEECIIGHLIKNNSAEILWDVDDYYLKNGHEAGEFMRKYQKDPLLGRNFTTKNTVNKNKNIVEIASSTWSAQAKVAGKIIDNLRSNSDWKEEKTAIILPDENLLVNLLNSFPDVNSINITMGFPLFFTHAYSLVENLLRLFKNRRLKDGETTHYYHTNVFAVLKHPLLYRQIRRTADDIMKRAQMENYFYIDSELLLGKHKVLDVIFHPDKQLPGDIIDILELVKEYTYHPLEKIYINSLSDNLEALRQGLETHKMEMKIDALSKLVEQIARISRIPFEGEPLEGLQVMGLMESRNIDFDHVIILNMNEGHMPKNFKANSFIPYGIRKAYGMMVRDEMDGLQSYLFYRLFHKAKNIYLLYNAIGEDVGGEKSRYLYQLEFEMPAKFTKMIANEALNPTAPVPISIKKDDNILEILDNFMKEGEGSQCLTPSAINSFLECKLKFYFNKICGLYEKDDLAEDVDAKIYGTLFHKVMEKLYPKGSEVDDNFLKERKENINEVINKAFQTEKIPGFVDGEYEGRNAIVKEAVKEMAKEILRFDKEYAPFKVVGSEYGKSPKGRAETLVQREITVMGQKRMVNLGSIIDRIDLKDGKLRVMDYKTGSDKLRFNSVEELFNYSDKNRKKAVFQVFFYSMIAHEKFSDADTIVPCILSTRDVFNLDSQSKILTKLGKNNINNYEEVKGEFEERLDGLLQEIMNTEVFDQTEEVDICKYCDYNKICHRYT